ncbi:MAG: hypothetical protein NTZ01_01790 [Verrucomicrobia bacterium]|nr:hypothetical protein [Verrucomicrobiota bacterium]
MDIFLYFDETDASGWAKDSSGHGYDLSYRVPPDVRIDADVKKFGNGSLEILRPTEGDTAGSIHQSLLAKPYASLRGSLERFTIVCWILLPPEGGGESATLFRRDSVKSGGDSGLFTFARHPRLGLRFATKDGPAVSQAVPIENGEWIHLGMSFDRGVVTFYKNGGLVGTKVTTPVQVKNLPEDPQGKPSLKALGNLPAHTRVDDLGFFGETVLEEAEMRELCQKGLKEFVSKGKKDAKSPP